MDRSIRTQAESKRAALLGAGVSLVLAVVFSLFFYTCNTPLGPSIGSDNAMYLTMGTALSQGYAPYTEIFDHKGPLLFILQTIPQLFSEGYQTVTVFAQEVLFLWACLLLLARMARRAGVSALAVQLVYLAVYARLTDGGNLTEEYANLFTLIGFDALYRVFDMGDGLGFEAPKTFARPAFLVGVMAMLAFMVRANNMLVLAGAVSAVALCMLASRRFAQLGACAAYMLLGCLAAALPIVVWLMAHGALKDAVYGAIIHNMMYANTGEVSRVTTLLASHYGHYAIMTAAITCFGALAYFIRTRRIPLALALVAAAACGGYAAFISHKYYYHYQMLAVPAAALGAMQVLALIGESLPGKRRMAALAVCALCVVRLALCGAQVNTQRLADKAHSDSLMQDAKALYAMVPEEDRGSFLAYRVEPKWYVGAKALPCMRFYFLQEILGQADPAVMDEVAYTFETDPPKWVVIFYNREFGPPYDSRVAEIFETRYAFVAAQGEYQLLKLK